MPTFVHRGTVITWEFKRHHLARGLRLKVYADGRVLVTSSPRFASEASAEHFVRGQADWILAALEKTKAKPTIKPLRGSTEEYRRFKKAALEIVRERVTKFAPMYGVSFGRISIRNQKSRWGSCSRRGNLSFHYKIALIPRPLADYLVVHELCHLLSFNHSKRFWQLVEKTIPDYKHMRTLLKTFGSREED